MFPDISVFIASRNIKVWRDSLCNGNACWWLHNDISVSLQKSWEHLLAEWQICHVDTADSEVCASLDGMETQLVMGTLVPF